MQRRQLLVRPGVAGDEVQRGDRHVELGAFGVLQGEEFALRAVDVQRLQAPVAADAVLLVNHRGADRQFGEVADHLLGIHRAGAAGPVGGGPMAEYLAFGDDDVVFEPETPVDGGDGQAALAPVGAKIRPIRAVLGGDAGVGQELLEQGAAAGALRGEQNPCLRMFREEAEQGLRGLLQSGVGLKRRQRRTVELHAMLEVRP